MKSPSPTSTLITLLLTLPFITAHSPHPWAPAGPQDIRGPCPALNSLANHALINRNGKNLTVPDLVAAQVDIFNLSPELASAAAEAGLSLAPDPSVGHFALSDLNRHNAIEHDASLSRQDVFFVGAAGVAKFDARTFARFFAHFEGSDFIDLESAAEARFANVQRSRAFNPEFSYSAQNRIGGYLETVLYMHAMVDEEMRTVKEFVRILFEQERLPFNEGWERPTQRLDGITMASQVLQLALRTPEKVKLGTDEAVVSARDVEDESELRRERYGEQVRLG